MTDVSPHNLEHAARLAVRTDSMLGIDLVLVGAPPAFDVPVQASSTSNATPPRPASTQAPPIENRGPRAQGTRLTPVAIDDSFFDLKRPQAERLARLKQHHAEASAHCGENAHAIVFGEGAADASLMFVGEAPGTEEERLGRPFVERAGAKLDEMIKAMGLQRDEVYITHALKSRPPGTRSSEASDFALCGEFFSAQVRIIKPDVIVALGGPAAKLLLSSNLGITSLRGQWKHYSDGERDVALMPTFHPAYLLRNPTVEVRGQVWQDLQQVMKRLGLPLPS